MTLTNPCGRIPIELDVRHKLDCGNSSLSHNYSKSKQKSKGASMNLLKVSEVAEICGVRKETVYEWIKRGELASIHFDRVVRIDPNDLADFLKAHKKGAKQ